MVKNEVLISLADWAPLLLASGALLLGFAISPANLEYVDKTLRELASLVFEAEVEVAPGKPLTPISRVALALVGSALIFVSGASMA